MVMMVFFTTHELSLLLGRDANSSIRKYLHKAVKEGVLKKVARDIYCSEVAGFSDTLSGTLERIATKFILRTLCMSHLKASYLA